MPPRTSPISAKPDAQQPVVNIAAFRRDVYFLSALCLADKKIAGLAGIKNAADEHFNGETNRLLVLLSASARQLLDISAPRGMQKRMQKQECGKYWKNFPAPDAAPLKFRKACDSAIHAREILPYNPEGEKEDASGRICCTGIMVIRGRHGKRNTRAELNCAEFAKCCIMLSDYFLED